MTVADARPLTPNGEDRRADLLAHAARLFIERGYADTRMIDLAREAGVAKGLVYWYFDSKEALLAAVVADLRDRLRLEQATAVEGVDGALDRIERGVAVSVHFVAEHWRLYAQLEGPMLGEMSQDHATDAVAEIEAGQAAGLIRTDDSAVTLAYVVQGITNQLVTAHLRGHLGTVEDAAEAAARSARATLTA